MGRAGSGGLVLDLLQALSEGLRFASGGLQLALEAGGDLDLLALERLQRLGRTRADGLFLELLQTLGEGLRLASGGLQLALEAGARLHLLALGGVDAADHLAHRALDPADGQRLAVLGALDAVGEPLQRLRHAADLVGRMTRRLVAGLRRGARLFEVAGRRLTEVVLGRSVLGTFGHQPGHPFVKGKP